MSKTNQEILDAFNLRPQGMPHSENVKFLMKILELKDEQRIQELKKKDDEAVLSLQIAIDNLNRSHKQEMIELLESLPDPFSVTFESDSILTTPLMKIREWQNDNLNQLKP